MSVLEVSRLEQDLRVFGDVFVKQRVTLLSKAKSYGSQLDGSNKIGQQMQGNTLKKCYTASPQHEVNIEAKGLISYLFSKIGYAVKT